MLTTIDLMQTKPLPMWVPRHRDVIHWNGWMRKWVGIINGVNNKDNTVLVVVAGLPVLLADYSQSEIEKNTKIIKVRDITSSSGGAYSVHRVESGVDVWYIA